jgi:hypothetical protein
MQTKMDVELRAMRRDVARRNEEWARVKEEFAARAGRRPIPVEVEWLQELDRACEEAALSTSPANLQNLAHRA